MFIDLVRTRRSIRRFRPEAVEPEKVALLLEAALRAPSSRGLSPWEFIVVTDGELLRRLARAKQHGSDFLAGAPLGVVVCAAPERCDVWVEDTSIASMFLLLAAHDLGLGGCWIQIRSRRHDETRSAEEYVREVLGIPESIRVESIVAVGYPAEELPPHPREGLLFARVHHNRFGEPYRF